MGCGLNRAGGFSLQGMLAHIRRERHAELLDNRAACPDTVRIFPSIQISVPSDASSALSEPSLSSLSINVR